MLDRMLHHGHALKCGRRALRIREVLLSSGAPLSAEYHIGACVGAVAPSPAVSYYC